MVKKRKSKGIFTATSNEEPKPEFWALLRSSSRFTRALRLAHPAILHKGRLPGLQFPLQLSGLQGFFPALELGELFERESRSKPAGAEASGFRAKAPSIMQTWVPIPAHPAKAGHSFNLSESHL